MQRLPALLDILGISGATTNASRALADERLVAADVERFLVRFGHPADRAVTPLESGAGTAEVA